MPGEGALPIGELLDALPAGLPLSVEVPDTRRGDVPALEWAKMALDDDPQLPGEPMKTRPARQFRTGRFRSSASAATTSAAGSTSRPRAR